MLYYTKRVKGQTPLNQTHTNTLEYYNKHLHSSPGIQDPDHALSERTSHLMFQRLLGKQRSSSYPEDYLLTFYKNLLTHLGQRNEGKFSYVIK